MQLTEKDVLKYGWWILFQMILQYILEYYLNYSNFIFQNKF